MNTHYHNSYGWVFQGLDPYIHDNTRTIFILKRKYMLTTKRNEKLIPLHVRVYV